MRTDLSFHSFVQSLAITVSVFALGWVLALLFPSDRWAIYSVTAGVCTFVIGFAYARGIGNTAFFAVAAYGLSRFTDYFGLAGTRFAFANVIMNMLVCACGCYLGELSRRRR